MEVEGFKPPQVEVVPIRRSARTHRAPNRYKASILDLESDKILIAITAFYDYEIWKMDVKTAFLNGYLNEDIYMVQPEGFVDPNHPRKMNFELIAIVMLDLRVIKMILNLRHDTSSFMERRRGGLAKLQIRSTTNNVLATEAST
ncbi:retrotransposon protein, putative, ty1-copia subclass [Tanacetum coccineum]